MADELDPAVTDIRAFVAYGEHVCLAPTPTPTAPPGVVSFTDQEAQATVSPRPDLEMLCMLIRQSAAVDQERFAVVPEAAQIAADQVRDELAALKEAAPGAWIAPLFWMVMLTLLVETPLGGSLLASATSSLLVRGVQSSALMKRMAIRGSAGEQSILRALVESRALESGILINAGKAAETRLARQTAAAMAGHRAEKLATAELTAYGRYIGHLVAGTENAGVNLQALGKAAMAAEQSSQSSSGERETNHSARHLESVSVALVRAANEIARQQRLASAFHASALEALARSAFARGGNAQLTAVETIWPLIQWDSLTAIVRDKGDDDDRRAADAGDAIGVLRDRYARFFEAAIWAKLYGFDSPKIAAKPWPRSGVEFKNVPDELLSYWLARLCGVDGVPFAARGSDRTKQKSDLHQFLLGLGKAWAKSPGEVVVLGGLFHS